ncbi:MAG TPA: hypothetical protein VL989_00410 [Candidatus Sulfotelmatobacter sp.]|nr:hypothetical protein [Candidatus Sulfotelmatobacter sp.]
MSNVERQLETYEASIVQAETQFGQQVVFYGSESSDDDSSEALAVLTDNRTEGDFMPIPLDVCDYPHAKILGKIVLLQNPKEQIMQPAMLVPSPRNSDVVRLSTLNQPYVPTIGVSIGIDFALSTERQTQTAGFGEHGNAGAFEGGHFGTSLASGASEGVAQSLEAAGDDATHDFLEPGLHVRYKHLGLAPEEAIPTVTEIDTTLYKPGQRFPLYWHPSLETESGAIEPGMDNAARLLLGAAVSSLGQQGLDRAKRNIGNVIRGATLV